MKVDDAHQEPISKSVLLMDAHYLAVKMAKRIGNWQSRFSIKYILKIGFIIDILKPPLSKSKFKKHK